MYADLINIINKTAAYCEDKYSINHGGCCYFTYLIACELDKRKIKYKLAIQDCLFTKKFCRENRLKARKAIKSRRKSVDSTSLIHCNHFTLMIGDEIVNYEPYWSEAILISCIHAKDILWIYEKGLWNSEYKTKNNPIIQELVKNSFSRYEKRKEANKEGSIHSNEESLLCPLSKSDKALLM